MKQISQLTAIYLANFFCASKRTDTAKALGDKSPAGNLSISTHMRDSKENRNHEIHSKLCHTSYPVDQNSESKYCLLKSTDFPLSGTFKSPKVESFCDIKQRNTHKPGHRAEKADLVQELYLKARKARLAMNQRKSDAHPVISCVFGGESACYNVWRVEKVKPHCIFVAEDISIPKWINEAEESVPTVRCSHSMINSMLNATRNENYAGHFPSPNVQNERAFAQLINDSKLGRIKAIDRMLVLYMIRDPMNLGLLIRAATFFGFKHVVCVDCASLHNEKLIRASEGVIYDSSLCAFEVPAPFPYALQLLQDLSESAKLRACFAVPDQSAECVTKFARALCGSNNNIANSKDGSHGLMLFLGSEHHGLRSVIGKWKGEEPHFVSVQMDNPLLNSLNVSHAGSILMHALQPKSAPLGYLTSKKSCNK